MNPDDPSLNERESRTRGVMPFGGCPAAAQTVTTTLPRARPSLRYRMASATSLNANVLSTTGLTLPAFKNSRWALPGSAETAQYPGFGGVAFLDSRCLGCGVDLVQFKFDWCQHAETRVASASVVEDLDVLEDRVRELDAGLPSA